MCERDREREEEREGEFVRERERRRRERGGYVCEGCIGDRKREREKERARNSSWGSYMWPGKLVPRLKGLKK